MQKKGKLELTWVGKYDEEKPVEPRILIEDKDKSYGDPDSENMLIHGDNLIALQALQQDFAGKIKCIYIDPPFNTGQAFENYDDNLEMSIWLNLMRKRLVLLHELLRDDGTIFVHIDDSYLPYDSRTLSASETSPLTTGRMSTSHSPILKEIISWCSWIGLYR